VPDNGPYGRKDDAIKSETYYNAYARLTATVLTEFRGGSGTWPNTRYAIVQVGTGEQETK